MRSVGRILIAGLAVILSGCTGSQTGKGISSLDSKFFWESDYSDQLHSNSFWYSGYSDEQIEKAEKPASSGKDIWGNKASSGDSD